ncbi:hypothetical protein D9M71_389630 [compost metagenome]
MRDLETGLEGRVEQGVAIRRLYRVDAGQVGVAGFHQALDRVALAKPAAIEAQHPVQTAVEFDHVMAAGLVVQGVDVLGDQPADLSRALQPGQAVVGHVRLRQAHPWPAEHRPRPIAAPGRRGGEKLLVHHRLPAPPHALVVAIIGDARRCADAGTGQHCKRRVGHALMEAVELFVDQAVEHAGKPVGASLLAMVVNDNTVSLTPRGVLALFASKLAPTEGVAGVIYVPPESG